MAVHHVHELQEAPVVVDHLGQHLALVAQDLRSCQGGFLDKTKKLGKGFQVRSGTCRKKGNDKVRNRAGSLVPSLGRFSARE